MIEEKHRLVRLLTEYMEGPGLMVDHRHRAHCARPARVQPRDGHLHGRRPARQHRRPRADADALLARHLHRGQRGARRDPPAPAAEGIGDRTKHDGRGGQHERAGPGTPGGGGRRFPGPGRGERPASQAGEPESIEAAAARARRAPRPAPAEDRGVRQLPEARGPGTARAGAARGGRPARGAAADHRRLRARAQADPEGGTLQPIARASSSSTSSSRISSRSGA